MMICPFCEGYMFFWGETHSECESFEELGQIWLCETCEYRYVLCVDDPAVLENFDDKEADND